MGIISALKWMKNHVYVLRNDQLKMFAKQPVKNTFGQNCGRKVQMECFKLKFSVRLRTEFKPFFVAVGKISMHFFLELLSLKT